MRRFLTWKVCLLVGVGLSVSACCVILPAYIAIQQWRTERVVIGKWKAEYERPDGPGGENKTKFHEKLSLGDSGWYRRWLNARHFSLDENGKWRIVPGAGKGAEIVVEFETRLEFGFGKKDIYRRTFVPLEGDRIGMVVDSSDRQYDPPISYQRYVDP